MLHFENLNINTLNGKNFKPNLIQFIQSYIKI